MTTAPLTLEQASQMSRVLVGSCLLSARKASGCSSQETEEQVKVGVKAGDARGGRLGTEQDAGLKIRLKAAPAVPEGRSMSARPQWSGGEGHCSFRELDG